jgi:hypothetical protein
MAALVLALPGTAAAQKQGHATQATDQDYAALLQIKEMTGRLIAVGGSSKTLTIQIDVPSVQPGGNNSPHVAMPHVGSKGRNPQQQAQQLQRLITQIQRQQARTRTTMNHKDFELQTAADVKVRWQQPPTDYDDKGNPKKYTAKELQELKGNDPSLPGYKGEFDNLKAGQTVKVTLARVKTPAKDKEDKDKKKDKDAPSDAASKVEITRVVIVKDGEMTEAPKGKNK